MTTKDLLAIGVTLSAKDMYTSIFSKAKQDLRLLNADAKEQAAQFERSLTLGKGMVVAGGTAAVIGAQFSRYFDDVVRQSAEAETAIADLLITGGDQAAGMEERTRAALDSIQGQWTYTDQQIADATAEIVNRTRDYSGSLEAVCAAAVLARARKMDLGQATSWLTDRIEQQNEEERKGLDLTQRSQAAAAQLSVVQKALGSHTDLLSGYFGRMGGRLGALKVPFTEVGALLMYLGRTGQAGRASQQSFEAMLDAMVKLQTAGNFTDIFPEFSQRGGLVNMLADVNIGLGKIKSDEAKVAWLQTMFGEGAPMVLQFARNLEEVRRDTELLKKADYGEVMAEAERRMRTALGTQERMDAAVEEFKEMLGRQAIPTVEWFQRRMTKAGRDIAQDRFWAALLSNATLGVGVTAKVAEVGGPLSGLIGLYNTWKAGKALEILVKANATGNAAALGLGALALRGGAAGLGLVAGAGMAYGSWQIGQGIAKVAGIPTYEEWSKSKRNNAPGAGNFEMDEIVVRGESPRRIAVTNNVQVYVDGKEIAARVKDDWGRELERDSLRQP